MIHKGYNVAAQWDSTLGPLKADDSRWRPQQPRNLGRHRLGEYHAKYWHVFPFLSFEHILKAFEIC
ncbi:MAG TPA: hypothetical protein VKP30_13045, partial [Polyangiaceae bacterium]|nr:hypothetical protein [Polyangiaceae bacterium]